MIQPLLADEGIRYYDIEIVVFENLAESGDNNEIWPKGKHLEIPENVATLGHKYAGEIPPEYDKNLLFKLLKLEDYKLSDEVSSLKETENYRVLLHTGWRQPGLARDKAIPIHFTHAISDETGTLNEAPQETAANEPLTTPEKKAEYQFGPTIPTHLAHLQGIITIALARYLHIDVEMLYRKEGQEQTVDMFDTSFLEDRTDREPVYYMKQNRRMRSKETHYIDHPKFSVLVRITPFIIEEPAEAVTPPNS